MTEEQHTRLIGHWKASRICPFSGFPRLPPPRLPLPREVVPRALLFVGGGGCETLASSLSWLARSLAKCQSSCSSFSCSNIDLKHRGHTNRGIPLGSESVSTGSWGLAGSSVAGVSRCDGIPKKLLILPPSLSSFRLFSVEACSLGELPVSRGLEE